MYQLIIDTERQLRERRYEKMDETNIQVQKSPLPFLTKEPVAIVAVIRAALALAIGFGFELSPEQMALIITFVEVVLALFTRQQVTPFVSSGTAPQVEPVETPQLKQV
jgi:hypothetical protein